MENLLIPPWISSKSYVVDQTHAMAIISNQKTHRILLLRNESAVIWSWIELGNFKERATLSYLTEVGSQEPAEDLKGFISELVDAQCLVIGVSVSYEKPEAPPEPDVRVLVSSISPVTSEEDKALEDEVATFAEKHGFLFSAFWEVTNRCNEKCIHCFNPGAPHAEREKSNRDTQELTTEEGFRLIRSFREAGAYRLILSGGEVFLRKDIFELIASARDLHMQVHLFTNGIILDDQRLEKLAKLYPESVSISLYSANPELHDSVTRVPGSFKKSVNALRKLNDLGIKTTIKAIQMAHTVQGYANIEDLALSVGARTTVEMNMSAGNDGAQGPLELAVAREAELIALAVTPGSPIFVGDASSKFGERRRRPDEIFCSAGQSMLSVTSDGKVYPCVALPLEVGNVAHHDVQEIWSRSSVGKRQASVKAEDAGADGGDHLSVWQAVRVGDYQECGTHDRCGWCNKCPGMSLNETGSALNASIVQCRIATARMEGARLLRSGQSRDQILRMLDVPESFGRDVSLRSVPAIPIRFISQQDWVNLRRKNETSARPLTP